MLKDDAGKFAMIMGYLSVCFPEREMTPQTVDVYFDSLSTFDIDAIGRAAKIYVLKGTRFPLVSDLVSLL
jgi:hypothetical protein